MLKNISKREICEICGGCSLSKAYMKYHRKTKKHIANLKNNANTNILLVEKPQKQNIFGKALEYAICKRINDTFGISTTKTSDTYNKYSLKFDLLEKEMKDEFYKTSSCVVDWIEKKFCVDTFKETLLLPDQHGNIGVVADIVIRTRVRYPTIGLSIKNTKLYAKSPRPLSFLDHADLQEIITNKWRTEYKAIIHGFYNNYKDYKTFKNIPYSNAMKEYLYEPINILLTEYLCNFDTNNTQTIFMFLTSIDKNYVIVNKKNHIEIYDHTVIHRLPDSFIVTIDHRGYIILTFDNNFIFSMRLHTASSRLMKEVSLKYDVVLVNTGEIYPLTILNKI